MIDDEVILDSLVATVKANLNTCIAAMNTAKGDTMLDDISDNAWYENTLDDGMFNYQNFVMYGIIDEKVIQEEGPVTMEEITTNFEIVVVDSGNDAGKKATRSVRRYKNTLKQLMHKYHRNILGGVKFKVSGLTPATFEVNGQKFITAGISVKAVIG